MPGIQEFVSSMSKARGFARTSKYAVVITPPANLAQLASEMTQAGPAGRHSEYANTNAHKMQQTAKLVGKQINLHCNSVSLPGHDMQAQDVQHGSAPGRQIVQSHDYNGTIAASFYLDSHLRERIFFEQWQKMIVNKSTHKAYYYDDYIGSMEIFQLDGNGDITYGIKATEVYPTTIAGIEYAYANTNQIAIQSVNFQYRQWFNMTSDAIAGYTSNSIGVWQSRQKEIDKVRAQLDTHLKATQMSVSGVLSESVKKQEADRQRRLRQPEIDRQDQVRDSRQREADRQKHLKKPDVDRGPPPPLMSVREANRQKQLRSPNVDGDQQQLAAKKQKVRELRLRQPELDRQDKVRDSRQREADRQKHLKKPEVDIDRQLAAKKSKDRELRLLPPNVDKRTYHNV